MTERTNIAKINHFKDQIQQYGMDFNITVHSQESKIELPEWDRHTRWNGTEVPVLEDISGTIWIGLGARDHLDLQASLLRNGIESEINDLTHFDLRIGKRRQAVSIGIPYSLDLENHTDERKLMRVLNAIPEERIDSAFKVIEVDLTSSVQRVKVLGSDEYTTVIDTERIGELKNIVSIQQHDQGKVRVVCKLENFPKELLKR